MKGEVIMTSNEVAVGNSVKKRKTKKRKIASLDRRKARSGWFFVLPFVVGFVCIYLPIIISSIQLSFSKITTVVGGGTDITFVGFENYGEALFKDASFVQTLVSGIQNLVFEIPAILIFALFMAVLLNQKMVGRAAFRAIFFIPVVLSTGLIEAIDAANIVTSSMEGGINSGAEQSTADQIVSSIDIQKLFESMQFGSGLAEIVTDIVNNIFDIVNKSGVQMLIFLSGLQSISPAIYESCQIDGATAWETFWKITFPMISPMILVNAVYTIIDSFTSSSNVVMSYIDGAYKTGQALSTAMAWFYFLVVILIVGAVAGIFSAFVFYQKRD